MAEKKHGSKVNETYFSGIFYNSQDLDVSNSGKAKSRNGNLRNQIFSTVFVVPAQVNGRTLLGGKVFEESQEGIPAEAFQMEIATNQISEKIMHLRASTDTLNFRVMKQTPAEPIYQILENIKKIAGMA